MSIRGEDVSVIDEMFDSRKTLHIPVYQRNYDWKEYHCEKLISDIEKAVDRETKEYFIGSFVLVRKEDDKKSFYIIDGQQRITTIILLLLAMLDYAKSNNEPLKTSIEKLIFSDVKDRTSRLFLKQIQKDDFYLNKIVNGDKIEKGSSNIINNYLYFKNRLNNDDKYVSKLWKGLDLLKCIKITLEQEDEPQIIFETLNATGLSLKEGDKIRNYILMYKNQDELYNKYWIKIEENCLQSLNDENVSIFIRFFLAIKNKDFSKEAEVYNDFKKYLENKDNEEVLKELLEYSKYFNLILDTSKSTKISYILDNIKELKVNILNPFIMLLIKYNKENIIHDNILYNCLFLIENYIVRRLICSKPSNALNKICLSLIKKLYIYFEKNIQNTTLIDYISSALIEFKGSGEFPSDEEVINHIIDKDMYKGALGKHILKTLELINNKKEKIIIDRDISIEHIMPQTLNMSWKKIIGNNYKEIHEKYLNSIGNLTLTGNNSKLSNNSLEEKQKIYRDSKFIFLNKDLIDLKEYNENIILNRANRLIQSTLDYYKYPNIIIEQNEIKEYVINDDIDFTDTNIVSFEYKNNIFKVNKWTELLYTILSFIYEERSVEFTEKILNNELFKNRITKDKKHSETYRRTIEYKNKFIINVDTNTNSKIKLILNIMDTLDIEPEIITLHIKNN